MLLLCTESSLRLLGRTCLSAGASTPSEIPAVKHQQVAARPLLNAVCRHCLGCVLWRSPAARMKRGCWSSLCRTRVRSARTPLYLPLRVGGDNVSPSVLQGVASRPIWCMQCGRTLSKYQSRTPPQFPPPVLRLSLQAMFDGARLCPAPKQVGPLGRRLEG